MALYGLVMAAKFRKDFPGVFCDEMAAIIEERGISTFLLIRIAYPVNLKYFVLKIIRKKIFRVV